MVALTMTAQNMESRRVVMSVMVFLRLEAGVQSRRMRMKLRKRWNRLIPNQAAPA